MPDHAIDPATVTEPADTGSLADYEAAIHQPAVDGTAPAAEPAVEDETDEPAAEPDKPAVRHRAQSQQAKADDIVSIAALAKRVAEVEEREGKDITQKDGESNRVFKLRRRAELAERREQAAKAPKPAPHVPRDTPRPVEPKPSDRLPRPQASEIGTKYADYDEFTVALAKHAADEQWESRESERVKQNRQAEAHAESQRIQTAWNAKTAAAKAKYPDFQAVALEAPTKILAGSVPDLFILEHKAGADVLYHLQQHGDELDALLTKPALEQIEVLSLLAQRLTTTTAADSTGAAPRANSQPAPKPPTPVRGGPSRPADEPPTADDTPLSEHEKAFHKARR